MLFGLFFCSWLIAGGPLWTAPLGLYFVSIAAWGLSPIKALLAKDPVEDKL